MVVESEILDPPLLEGNLASVAAVRRQLQAFRSSSRKGRAPAPRSGAGSPGSHGARGWPPWPRRRCRDARRAGWSDRRSAARRCFRSSVAGINHRDPAQRLMRRGDVVAVGGKDHQRDCGSAAGRRGIRRRPAPGPARAGCRRTGSRQWRRSPPGSGSRSRSTSARTQGSGRARCRSG